MRQRNRAICAFAATALALPMATGLAHADEAVTPNACTGYSSVTGVQKNASGTLGIHLTRKSCSGLLYYRAVVHNYSRATISNRTIRLGACPSATDGPTAKPAIGAGKDWTSKDYIENLRVQPNPSHKGVIISPSGAAEAATTCV